MIVYIDMFIKDFSRRWCRYNINEHFHIKLNIFTSSLSLDNGMLCVLRYTVMIMIKGKVYNTNKIHVYILLTIHFINNLRVQFVWILSNLL